MISLLPIKEYIKEPNKIYAHTSSNSKVELLFDHLELTFFYYQELCKEKNINMIVQGIIQNMKIIDRCVNQQESELIYQMFVHAIYLHDIGKINPSFQKQVINNPYFLKEKNYTSEHSIISALIYIDLFTEQVHKKVLPKVQTYFYHILYSFAYSISRHHGYLKNTEDFLKKLYSIQKNKLCFSQYKRKKIFDIPLRNIEENPFERRRDLYPKWKMDSISFYILNKLLYSLIVGCDYYATYSYYTGKKVDIGSLQSIDQFCKRYTQSHIYNGIQKYQKNKEYFKKEPINALRSELFLEAIEKLDKYHEKNIFYLEAPTGSGKTNVSIALALKLLKQHSELKNLFYIFPFNTLVDQTAETLGKYFEENKDYVKINSITPIVQKVEKNIDKGELIDYETSYLDRQFMHYPIVLTSHINLFSAFFGIGREANFLLQRLCNSVVIIDEIQAYRNDIWREIILFLDVFSSLLNIKVIIMSATLPELHQMLDLKKTSFVRLISNPKKYYNHSLFQNRVKLNFDLLEKGVVHLDFLKQNVGEILKNNLGKKVLIEFITKNTAREFYNQVKDIYPNWTVLELSGDDNQYIRQKVIRKIKNRNKKNLLVIATQVIEAGIDIDMDIGFKDISLLDSEEQFLGRINRSCMKQNATAYFFHLDPIEKVYKKDQRIHYTLLDKDIQEYLKNKDFKGYYNLVLKRIYEATEKFNSQNMKAVYQYALQLNYEEIEKRMTLIEDKQVSLFLGYIFTKDDGSIMDGRKVWKKYVELLKDPTKDYAQKKVELSVLMKEMQYFIFNVTTYIANQNYDERLGYYYKEYGDEFIEDGKFNRKKFQESTEGLFW
ncbi:MAG: CRISPR-associated helicase Cas3' [Tissierellia bacterium]|nr:CRISPR-associated helicase Cas3' [Tissierellia bacterium]